MEINKAIDLLDNLIGMVDDNQENDYDAAFHMAIDALKAQAEKRTQERTETHACDCISRQAAIDAISCDITVTGRRNAEVVATTIGTFVDRIKELPPAQPEIVRCKDCKYWREGTVYSYCDKLYGMGVLDAYDYMTAEDDYCSNAERRTDGQAVSE